MRLSFDLRTVSLLAIQKAAYKFTDVLAFNFAAPSEIEALVEVSPKKECTSALLDQFVNDLRNEVLDQHLRELIAKETAPVRNLILAQAFSKTSLINSGPKVG
jgi:His-Xaa-Ser system protein HxsD